MAPKCNNALRFACVRRRRHRSLSHLLPAAESRASDRSAPPTREPTNQNLLVSDQLGAAAAAWLAH